jgi:hypothetical protein
MSLSRVAAGSPVLGVLFVCKLEPAQVKGMLELLNLYPATAMAKARQVRCALLVARAQPLLQVELSS